jgi:hypothetical protein
MRQKAATAGKANASPRRPKRSDEIELPVHGVTFEWKRARYVVSFAPNLNVK